MNKRRRQVNPNLVAFLTGLLLLAIGAGLAWPPAGLMAPGLVLLFVSLAGDRGERKA